MPDRYAETHIRQHPLFQNLPPQQLNYVVQAFEMRHYDPGDTIFQEGDTTRGLWILTDGEAVFLRQSARGGYQRVGNWQPGQELNRQALFSEGQQTATLQATGRVNALLLRRDRFAQLLSNHPEIAQAMGLRPDAQHHMHDVHFSTQREDERVLHKTHRHPWAYLRWLWIPAGIMFACWLMAYLMPSIAVVWVLLSAVIPSGLAGYIYVEWKNDTVVITDQRVKKITFNIPTLSEVRDEVSIGSVQETNVIVPPLDVFAFLLGYGHIEIKTAGSAGNFTLDFMPRPQRIQNLLMESFQEHRRAKEEHEQEAIRADLERWLNPNQPNQPDSPPNQANSSSDVMNDDDPEVNVTADEIEKFGTRVSGPMSPFVTSFETQGGATVFRKHWLIWIRRVIPPLLLVIASLILAGAMLSVSALQAFVPIGLAIPGVMFLVGAVWAYFADWDWRHDYYVLTDTNITLIHQRPLFLQSENDKILLRQVDNVVAESSGVFEQLLKYGNVQVALVGGDVPKHLNNVAQPIKVQSEISRRQKRLEQRQEAERHQAQRNVMKEYISTYHQINQQNQTQQQFQQSQQQGQLPWQQQNNQQSQQSQQSNPQWQQQQQQPSQPRISPAAPRDRNRPPGYPQQQNQSSSSQNQQQRTRPAMSSGRPYQPQQQQQNNPPPPPQNNQQWQQQQSQQQSNQQWQQQQTRLNPNQQQGQNWHQQQQNNQPPPPPPMSLPQQNRSQSQSSDERPSSRPPGVPRRRTDS